MSSVRSQYTKEIANRFGGYYAAWTPGDPLELGDIGTLDGKVFTRVGNLRDLDIKFARREDTTPETMGPYASKNAVEVSFKAAGKAALPNSQLAQADAGFSIQFKREGASFFVAEGCFQPSIENQIQLGRDIMDAYKKGAWQRHWHVITQIVEAESFTVLICDSSTGSIDLKASADLDVVPKERDLAKLSLGLETVFSSNVQSRLVAQAGATPMFRLSALKRKLLGIPNFEPVKSVPIELAHINQHLLDANTPVLLNQHPELDDLVFGEV